jgi:RNA polymerase sigma-70 factor (ECF subfamily)
MTDKKAPEQGSHPGMSRPSLAGFEREEDLVRALHAGDGEALKIIFDRYHRLVLVTALRILHDVGEAEDLMQSVFFEIFQKAKQFDPSRGTLSKWILQYAYNRSINRKNYLALRQFYNTVDLFNSDQEEIWITKVSLLPQEAVRLVDEALATLNCEQREVLELVFFKDMTLKEIADQRKQELGNVRNHYYRGLKKLRSLLFRHGRNDDNLALEEQIARANA